MKLNDATTTRKVDGLQENIQRLKRRILAVGSLVETAIARSISALVHRDKSLAKAVIKADAEIDRAEVEVEEDCVRILEEHQPTGTDLRFVVASLKINSDLERMGDLAENISDAVISLSECERFRRVSGCREMAEKAQAMVGKSLQALVDGDVDLAREIPRNDEAVDRLQRQITERIEIELERCPENAPQLMQLCYLIRQLERLGDMATNVAEDVIYMVEGQIVRHEAID